MVNIGLVGSGYMAHEYLKASQAIKELSVKVIYSRNEKTAKALSHEYGEIEVAASLQILLTYNLDFIVVCVPELSTADVLFQALPQNIPILVEKPPGISLAEANLIEHEATRTGTPLFVALNRRFYNSTTRVLEEVSKTNSERFVHVIDQQDTIAATAAGQPSPVVNNWMFANSIHIIDYISLVCRGEPTLINWSKRIIGKDSSIVEAALDFSSGDKASYIGYWNFPIGWCVNISIAARSWQLAPLERGRSRSTQDRTYQDFEESQLDVSFKPGLVMMLKELVKCHEGNKHRLTSISEANRTMKLIDMIYPGA